MEVGTSVLFPLGGYGTCDRFGQLAFFRGVQAIFLKHLAKNRTELPNCNVFGNCDCFLASAPGILEANLVHRAQKVAARSGRQQRLPHPIP